MSRLAVLRDSLQNPDTLIRVFPLTVSFALKSWGLFKVLVPLEK